MKKFLYPFSLSLLATIGNFGRAMESQAPTQTDTTLSQENSKAQRQEKITGIAGVIDRAGTAAQYLALPLILATHADPTIGPVNAETILKAALLNGTLVCTANWIKGGPIDTYQEPRNQQENWPHSMGRKLVNGTIHATNFGAKYAILVCAGMITLKILGIDPKK